MVLTLSDVTNHCGRTFRGCNVRDEASTLAIAIATATATATCLNRHCIRRINNNDVVVASAAAIHCMHDAWSRSTLRCSTGSGRSRCRVYHNYVSIRCRRYV